MLGGVGRGGEGARSLSIDRSLAMDASGIECEHGFSLGILPCWRRMGASEPFIVTRYPRIACKPQRSSHNVTPVLSPGIEYRGVHLCIIRSYLHSALLSLCSLFLYFPTLFVNHQSLSLPISHSSLVLPSLSLFLANQLVPFETKTSHKLAVGATLSEGQCPTVKSSLFLFHCEVPQTLVKRPFSEL